MEYLYNFVIFKRLFYEKLNKILKFKNQHFEQANREKPKMTIQNTVYLKLIADIAFFGLRICVAKIRYYFHSVNYSK